MDKPLHVQVAEALGCSAFFHDDRWFCDPDKCEGGEAVHYPDGSHHSGPYGALPEYDTDWSATGPLIERYSIELERNSRTGSWACSQDEHDDSGDYGPIGQGPTPLLAVCNLILALKAAEKLDAHQSSPLTASPPTA